MLAFSLPQRKVLSFNLPFLSTTRSWKKSVSTAHIVISLNGVNHCTRLELPSMNLTPPTSTHRYMSRRFELRRPSVCSLHATITGLYGPDSELSLLERDIAAHCKTRHGTSRHSVNASE